MKAVVREPGGLSSLSQHPSRMDSEDLGGARDSRRTSEGLEMGSGHRIRIETMKKKHQDNLVETRAVPESDRARIEPQGMRTALQNHPEEAGEGRAQGGPTFGVHSAVPPPP